MTNLTSTPAPLKDGQPAAGDGESLAASLARPVAAASTGLPPTPNPLEMPFVSPADVLPAVLRRPAALSSPSPVSAAAAGAAGPPSPQPQSPPGGPLAGGSPSRQSAELQRGNSAPLEPLPNGQPAPLTRSASATRAALDEPNRPDKERGILPVGGTAAEAVANLKQQSAADAEADDDEDLKLDDGQGKAAPFWRKRSFWRPAGVLSVTLALVIAGIAFQHSASGDLKVCQSHLYSHTHAACRARHA